MKAERPRRSKVYLEIYQLADIYPDDLGYRIRCKLCGDSRRWLDQETALGSFADHLKAQHGAHGGKRLRPKDGKSTVTE